MTDVTRLMLLLSASPAQKVKRSQHHKGAREQQEQDDHADSAEDCREGIPEADLSNKNDQNDENQNWHLLGPGGNGAQKQQLLVAEVPLRWPSAPGHGRVPHPPSGNLLPVDASGAGLRAGKGHGH